MQFLELTLKVDCHNKDRITVMNIHENSTDDDPPIFRAAKGPPNGRAHMILRPCGQRSRKIRIINEAVWMVTVWHFSSGTGRESLCGNKLNHLSLDTRATPLRISRKLVSSKQWHTVLRAERNLRFCVFCLPSLHCR